MNEAESARWLDYATSDLAAAGALLATSDHFPRQVCFLAQQAAEKALKAALILLQIEFPFSHDLDRLRDLLPDDWQVRVRHADLADLTIWAVEARYPADMPEVLPVDARNAVMTATSVLQLIREDINRLSSG